jgi:hypothetical protein
MKQTIYYKSSGYDRTIYNFFIIERETKAFVFLNRLTKLDKDAGVIAGEPKVNSDTIKLSKKKFNMCYTQWNNQPLIENHNYTYTGA